MCREASFVVVKGYKCFWSKNTDSHPEIRREFGLPENGIGRVTSVQVEIVPPHEHEFYAPISDWVFNVDQDDLPEWWDAEEVEKQVRIELKNWISAKVALPGETKEIRTGVCFAMSGSFVKAYDRSTVKACGSSTVTACGSSTVKAFDSSTVTAYDRSTVKAYDRSTVKAYDRSTVKACGSSTVTACGSSTVTAFESSTVTAFESSTVKACCDYATVMAYCKFACTLTGLFATLITKFGSKPKMFAGTEKGKTVDLNKIK